MAILLLCFCSTPLNAQNRDSQRLTFSKQVRFSISTVIYDNLKLSNEGRDHLGSLPTLSGELTVSYYQQISNSYGLIIGGGIGVTPYNLKYKFLAPENSPFVFDDGSPFELELFHNDYDGIYFQVPLSLHKVFETYKKHNYSIEAGVKLNVQNVEFDYLPYRWEYSSEYEVDGDNIPLFTSYQETNGILALSYFLKLGIIKQIIDEHTLEYRLVLNWSPTVLRKGEYEFHNLPYVSRGSTEQNINFIGFEFTFGLTRLRNVQD